MDYMYRYFHVTCAINSGLIPVKRSNFDNFSFACTEHRSEDQVRTRPRASRGRLVKKEMLHSSEDEEEEEEEEDEDEDDGDDDVDEDAIMEEVSDDEVPKKKSSPRRNNLRSASRPGVKRRSTASHGSKTGPLKLFLSDQSDTDEEQQKPAKEQQRVPMKEEEELSKQQRTTESTAAAATTSSAGGLSFRERIEAKRKKASLGQRQAAETSSLTAAATTTKPTSAPPTNAKAAPAPATAPNGSSKPSSSVQQQQQQPAPPQQAPVHKQKLPNKTHLAPNPRPANTQNGSGLKRPSASAAPVPVIKDLDEAGFAEINMLFADICCRTHAQYFTSIVIYRLHVICLTVWSSGGALQQHRRSIPPKHLQHRNNHLHLTDLIGGHHSTCTQQQGKKLSDRATLWKKNRLKKC